MATTLTPEQQLDEVFEEARDARVPSETTPRKRSERRRQARATQAVLPPLPAVSWTMRKRDPDLSAATDSETKKLQAQVKQLGRDIAAANEELERQKEFHREADKNKKIVDNIVQAVQRESMRPRIGNRRPGSQVRNGTPDKAAGAKKAQLGQRLSDAWQPARIP